MAVAVIGGFAAAGAPAAGAEGAFSQWTPTGAMFAPRVLGFAVRLQNGKVLAGGGLPVLSMPGLASTEIYNPASGSWSGGADMDAARVAPGAAVLNNGSVLVVGGAPSNAPAGSLATGDVYNPATNSWTPVSNTTTTAHGVYPATVLLPNGNVLIAGGADATGTATNAAAIYDPATNKFTAAAAMHDVRAWPTGTLLPDGNVLVAGGGDASNVPEASAEVYNPTANTWTLVSNSMSSARLSANAALLPSGEVLVVGGESAVTPTEEATATTDLYDPTANTFTPGPSMSDDRAIFGLVSLPGGRVLVAGGANINSGTPAPDPSSELYSPATNSWSPAGALPGAPIGVQLTTLPDGQILGDGGTQDLMNGSAQAELFTPTTVPGAPSVVSLSSGTGSALVNFAPPASDGGLTIEHYTVKASTGQTVATPDGRTSADVTGLKNGVPVTFTVTATNSLGTGPASASSAPVIIGPPELKLSGLKTKLKLKVFLGGLKFTVTPNKAVALQISLLGNTAKATISRAYDLMLASKSFGQSAAKRSVTLKPSRKLVGNPKHAKVELVIVAAGPDGGRSTTTKTISISR